MLAMRELYIILFYSSCERNSCLCLTGAISCKLVLDYTLYTQLLVRNIIYALVTVVFTDFHIYGHCCFVNLYRYYTALNFVYLHVFHIPMLCKS